MFVCLLFFTVIPLTFAISVLNGLRLCVLLFCFVNAKKEMFLPNVYLPLADYGGFAVNLK